MILIFSKKIDPDTLGVIEWLKFFKVNFIRIDYENFKNQIIKLDLNKLNIL
jgi:hypothetical protein